MASAWTTTELLASIRQQGRIPDDDPDATDAKLLLEADRQMNRVFVPLVRKARSDYYIRHEDQTLVSGQQNYTIPARAVAGTVRTVTWIDTSTYEREIPPVALTERYIYSQAIGNPQVYAVEDDCVTIFPTPTGTQGTLRIYYEYAPSQLVLPATALLTLGYSADFKKLLSAGDPTPLYPADTLFDLMRADGTFSLLVADGQVLSVGAFFTEFFIELTATTNVSRLATGGIVTLKAWLTAPRESVIPQIPAELHPALALAVAAQWLLPIDADAGGLLKSDLAGALQAATELLTPRQIGRQQKIKSSSSMMRRGRRNRSRGFLGSF